MLLYFCLPFVVFFSATIQNAYACHVLECVCVSMCSCTHICADVVRWWRHVRFLPERPLWVGLMCVNVYVSMNLLPLCCFWELRGHRVQNSSGCLQFSAYAIRRHSRTCTYTSMFGTTHKYHVTRSHSYQYYAIIFTYSNFEKLLYVK